MIQATSTQQGSGYSAFTTGSLSLHTDRSGVENPPDLLVFYCIEPAEQGGESLFADGRLVYHHLVYWLRF
ncbi:TauD/TfdA family dioxygenase [Laceyella tengchongensis]|uniref:TauD/TfdA family dioxygenase n=1 Tax=Laceyella tengchongensis TaxID=574699 RepID=UPI003A5227CB